MDKRIFTFRDLTKEDPIEGLVLAQEERPLFLAAIKPGIGVSHKSFGRGRVVEINNSIISIAFGGGEKKFPFPDVFFAGYVKILD